MLAVPAHKVREDGTIKPGLPNLFHWEDLGEAVGCAASLLSGQQVMYSLTNTHFQRRNNENELSPSGHYYSGFIKQDVKKCQTSIT